MNFFPLSLFTNWIHPNQAPNQAPTQPIPPQQVLLSEVVDLRIRTLATGFHAKFALTPIALINQKIEVLRAPIRDALSRWDEASLKTYLEWQRSPLVQKIEDAISSGQLGSSEQLDQILLPDELQVLKAFNQSPVGQLKKALDKQLQPRIKEVVVAIRRG